MGGFVTVAGKIVDVCIEGSDSVHLKVASVIDGGEVFAIEITSPEVARQVVAEAWGVGEVLSVLVPLECIKTL
ncbi:hypothetical protein [Streptomyces sp. NPDC007083]|uniref:hypothetical protein n=1 Tax=unclassified Streptomyces TaxID=2593676 RepID=UPI0033F06D5F